MIFIYKVSIIIPTNSSFNLFYLLVACKENLANLIEKIQNQAEIEESGSISVELSRFIDDLPQSASQGQVEVANFDASGNLFTEQSTSFNDANMSEIEISDQSQGSKYESSTEQSSVKRENLKLKKAFEKSVQQREKRKSGKLCSSYEKSFGDKSFATIFDQQLKAHSDIENDLKKYGFFSIPIIENAAKPIMTRQVRHNLVFNLVNQSELVKLKNAHKHNDTNWNRRVSNWFNDDWSDYALFGQIIKVIISLFL